MIKDFADGVQSYFKVLPLINKFHLKKYLVLSGILSLMIAAALFNSVYFLYDDFGDWIEGFYRWEFGKSYFEKASNWIAGGIITIFSFMAYKYIVMIVLSPILSIMSSKVEQGLNGYHSTDKLSLTSIIKDVIRGLGITFRNLFRELFLTLLLVILGLFPLFAIVSGPAILLVQAYYAGFGNMDYYLERHYNIRDSANFVKRHKGLAIANGGIFLLFLIIPILGAVLAPTWATIASSMELHKRV